MRQPSFLIVLTAAAVLSTAGAVMYRARAIQYERQWSEAMEQLATLNTPRLQTAPSRMSTLPRRVVNPEDGSDLLGEQDRLISDLLGELEQRERHIDELRQAATAPRGFPSPEDRRQQLEAMRETDPERYAEIIARQEAFRERMQEAFADRAAILLAGDSATRSPAEAARFEQLIETLQKTWDLADRLASPETPPEERRALREELMETSRELRPMLAEERERRLIELGLSSGYSPEEARIFSDYIQQTFEATSIQRLPGVRGGTRPERGGTGSGP